MRGSGGRVDRRPMWHGRTGRRGAWATRYERNVARGRPSGASGGQLPRRLDEIETRGEPLDHVRRQFVRPVLVPWNPAAIPLLR
jgi:hypothetical protein